MIKILKNKNFKIKISQWFAIFMSNLQWIFNNQRIFRIQNFNIKMLPQFRIFMSELPWLFTIQKMFKIKIFNIKISAVSYFFGRIYSE